MASSSRMPFESVGHQSRLLSRRATPTRTVLFYRYVMPSCQSRTRRMEYKLELRIFCPIESWQWRDTITATAVWKIVCASAPVVAPACTSQQHSRQSHRLCRRPANNINKYVQNHAIPARQVGAHCLTKNVTEQLRAVTGLAPPVGAGGVPWRGRSAWQRDGK